MKSIFFILTFIIILFLSSTSFALNPTIKKEPIKIYVGEKVRINNWGLFSTNIWIKYEGFITGILYRLEIDVEWRRKRQITYHIDESFIRVYVKNRMYYILCTHNKQPTDRPIN